VIGGKDFCLGAVSQSNIENSALGAKNGDSEYIQ
jgi:hypothetical protein